MAKTVSLNSAYYQLGYKLGETSTMKGSLTTRDIKFFRIPFSGTVFSAQISYASAVSATCATLPQTSIRLINSTGTASAAKGTVTWQLGKKRGSTTVMALTAFSVKPNQIILVRHVRQGTGGGAGVAGAAILTLYMRPQV